MGKDPAAFKIAGLLILLAATFNGRLLDAQASGNQPFSAIPPVDLISCADMPQMQSALNSLADDLQPHGDLSPPDVVKAAKAEESLYTRCAPKMTDEQKACFSNVRTYIQSKHMTYSGETDPYLIDLEVTDKAEIQKASNNFYDMTTLPGFISNGLPVNWKEILNRCQKPGADQTGCPDLPPGTKFLEYMPIDCALTGARAIIGYMPGADFDRYVIFRGGRMDPQMLVVQKKSPDGTPLEHPKPYWMQMNSENHTVSGGGGRCIHCHDGGPNKIYPVPGSITFGDTQTLAQLNQAVTGYGKISTEGLVDRTHRGPVIGNQSCVACHNTNENGLRPPLVGEEEYRVEQMVTRNWAMPPPSDHAYADVMAAFDKTSQLSSSDQKKVSELYVNENVSDPQARVTNICDQQKLNQVRRAHLQLLKDKNLISAEDLPKLEADVDLLDERGNKYYKNILTERASMESWLAGEKSNCLTGGVPIPNGPGPGGQQNRSQ